MTHDVLVLDTSAAEPLAEALVHALEEKGITCALGGADRMPAGERVLLVIGDSSDAAVLAAVRSGAAVLPVDQTEGWLADAPVELKVKRVVDLVDGLLIIGRPARQTSQETIDRALTDIERRFDSAADESPLVRVCETLALAIQWGAPIYNAGSAEGCAAIYDQTARSVLTWVEETVARGEGRLLDAIGEELNSVIARLTELPEGAFEQRAWTLRNSFDRILIARHTADALYAVDDLFAGLMRAGRALNASLIYDVVSMAISHGAPIYNAGSPVGCAQIYLCTAVGILRGLGAESRPDEGRTEALARDKLTALVGGGSRMLNEDPDALAWSLRRVFDALIETAAEERNWEHDS